jgi:signal transduction histidine kinase
VQSAPDLPVVSIDRGLFARALTNVIENALHAMPGTGTLSITSRQSPDGAAAADSSEPPAPEPATPRSVVVEIADTGVGMDDDALKRIFEPYFSTKATGTGLGLTIAKRNVELNGGRVQVNSRRGVGTTVTITLPA